MNRRIVGSSRWWWALPLLLLVAVGGCERLDTAPVAKNGGAAPVEPSTGGEPLDGEGEGGVEPPEDGEPPLAEAEPEPMDIEDGGGEEPLAALAPPLPTAHAWQPLLGDGTEEGGYAMYTYVLFGSPVDEALPPERLARYRATLTAIIGDTFTVEEALGSPVDEAERLRRMATLNVFLLPASAPFENAADLARYDSTLARRYLTELAHLRRRLGGDPATLLERPGPLFVSVALPLRESAREGEGYLLLADLSTLNPAAIREAVHAYKGWLADPGRGGEARFRSLRLALLDALLDADSLLTLVRTATADWRGLFE